MKNLQSECKGVAHMFDIVFSSLYGPFDIFLIIPANVDEGPHSCVHTQAHSPLTLVRLSVMLMFIIFSSIINEEKYIMVR